MADGAVINSNLVLDEIDKGNLLAMINREMRKVINDIADPNKLATKERVLEVKIKFKPNKQRNAAGLSYSVSHKPAGYVTTEDSDIFLGKDPVTGEYIARPHNMNQNKLFDESGERADEAPAS